MRVFFFCAIAIIASLATISYLAMRTKPTEAFKACLGPVGVNCKKEEAQKPPEGASCTPPGAKSAETKPAFEACLGPIGVNCGGDKKPTEAPPPGGCPSGQTCTPDGKGGGTCKANEGGNNGGDAGGNNGGGSSQKSNCVVTQVGDPKDQPTLPPECQNGDAGGGDAKALASQILANSKISLEPYARQDLQSTIDGQPIQGDGPPCQPTNLDPALLKILLDLAQNHTLVVWNFVTHHGCDEWQHPKGKATDIGTADDKDAWTNSAFRQDLANMLPAGAEMGQQGCPGSNTPTSKNNVVQKPDKCNHQHFELK